ncbi:hypothetical protein BH09ACT10_BH09ACT10_05780 [soil metagenome]
MRHLARILLGLVIAFVGVVALTPAASAHVLLDQAAPNGDGTVTLTFTFDHGCDASPTNHLEVSMPAGATALRAEGPSGWAAKVDTNKVTWSGAGIAPSSEGIFKLTARLEGEIGESLFFPTLQRCESGGSYDWKDLSSTSERPAPSLVATASVLSASTASTATVETGGADLRTVLVVLLAACVVAGIATRVAIKRA